MAPIVFLRGLNTYADERHHFGPIAFGEISGPLRRELALRGLEVIPLVGIGAGHLDTQIERAYRLLQRLPLWAREEKFHLLGHSAGGLMARALVHKPEIAKRVLSIGSIATPHHGAPMAELAHRLHLDRPRLQRLLAFFHYDTQAVSESFAGLSRASINSFNEQYPDIKNKYYFSMVCGIEPQALSLPFRAMRWFLPADFRHHASDGLVGVESQIYGAVLGRFALDHMMEVGVCLDPRPRVRRHFQLEFQRLCNELSRYYLDFGQIASL